MRCSQISGLTHRLSTQLVLIVCLVGGLIAIDTCSAQDETATRDRRHRQHLEKRQAIYDQLQRDFETVKEWCNEHQLVDAIPQIQAVSDELLNPAVATTPPRFVSEQVSIIRCLWKNSNGDFRSSIIAPNAPASCIHSPGPRCVLDFRRWHFRWSAKSSELTRITNTVTQSWSGSLQRSDSQG